MHDGSDWSKIASLHSFTSIEMVAGKTDKYKVCGLEVTLIPREFALCWTACESLPALRSVHVCPKTVPVLGAKEVVVNVN